MSSEQKRDKAFEKFQQSQSDATKNIEVRQPGSRPGQVGRDFNLGNSRIPIPEMEGTGMGAFGRALQRYRSGETARSKEGEAVQQEAAQIARIAEIKSPDLEAEQSHIKDSREQFIARYKTKSNNVSETNSMLKELKYENPGQFVEITSEHKNINELKPYARHPYYRGYFHMQEGKLIILRAYKNDDKTYSGGTPPNFSDTMFNMWTEGATRGGLDISKLPVNEFTIYHVSNTNTFITLKDYLKTADSYTFEPSETADFEKVAKTAFPKAVKRFLNDHKYTIPGSPKEISEVTIWRIPSQTETRQTAEFHMKIKLKSSTTTPRPSIERTDMGDQPPTGSPSRQSDTFLRDHDTGISVRPSASTPDMEALMRANTEVMKPQESELPDTKSGTETLRDYAKRIYKFSQKKYQEARALQETGLTELKQRKETYEKDIPRMLECLDGPSYDLDQDIRDVRDELKGYLTASRKDLDKAQGIDPDNIKQQITAKGEDYNEGIKKIGELQSILDDIAPAYDTAVELMPEFKIEKSQEQHTDERRSRPDKRGSNRDMLIPPSRFNLGSVSSGTIEQRRSISRGTAEQRRSISRGTAEQQTKQ